MDYGMQANRKTHRKQPKIPYSKTKKKQKSTKTTARKQTTSILMPHIHKVHYALN